MINKPITDQYCDQLTNQRSVSPLTWCPAPGPPAPGPECVVDSMLESGDRDLLLSFTPPLLSSLSLLRSLANQSSVLQLKRTNKRTAR